MSETSLATKHQSVYCDLNSESLSVTTWTVAHAKLSRTRWDGMQATNQNHRSDSDPDMACENGHAVI